MISNLRTFACFLILIITTSGCTDFAEPKIDLEGRKLVIVPFASVSATHFNDMIGIDLADLLTSDITMNGGELSDLTLKSQDDLEKSLKTVDPTTLTLPEIAKKVRANTIISGTLESFEIKGKGSIGFYQPKAVATVDCYFIEKNSEKKVFTKRVSSTGPGGYYRPTPTTTEKSPEEMKDMLIQDLAHEIGKLFYPYEPTDDDPGRFRN